MKTYNSKEEFQAHLEKEIKKAEKRIQVVDEHNQLSWKDPEDG